MKYELKLRLLRRRGSALIMAILVTMLLFIVGMAFLSEMITDKASVARIDEDAILDNAVDTVVQKINSVLVGDLFGPGGFLTGSAAYDYPGGVNYWLASLEPECIGDVSGDGAITIFDDVDGDGVFPDYYWPHITDLWGKWIFGNPKFSHFYDPLPQFRTVIDSDLMMTNPTSYYHLAWDYLNNPYADWNIVSGRMVCRIVSPDEQIRDAILNCMPNAPWWMNQYPYGANYDPVQLMNALNSFPRLWTPPLTTPIDFWDPRLPAPVPYDGPFPPIFNGLGLTRADADGDGVADSRWVQLYRIDQDGPWDYAIYAAVRIIDNGGMININTALRDPAIAAPPLLPVSNTRDGSLLTHINMDRHPLFYEPANKGIVAFNEPANTSALHAARIGSMLWTEIEYHNYVAMRLLNPVPGATPFDLTDELELRNRLLMTSAVIPRSAGIWTTTFDPPLGAVGVALPYTNTLQLANWFDKMTPDMNHPIYDYLNQDQIIGIYNRRHLVTTYNFDRTSHRGTNITYTAIFDPFTGSFIDVGPRKVGITLPNLGLGLFSGFTDLASKNLYIDQLAGAIYRGLPTNKDIRNRFGKKGSNSYTRKAMAWQYAVNLVDYQDDDDGDILLDGPQYPTHRRVLLKSGRRADFFGVERAEDIRRDSLYVSALGYVDDITVPLGDVFVLELFNPGATDKDFSVADFKITNLIDNLADPNIESMGIAGLPTIGAGDVLVISNLDKAQVQSAFNNFGINFDINADFLKVDDLKFEKGDQIVIYKKDYPISGVDMPVDSLTVPSGVVVRDFSVHTRTRIKEIGDGSGNKSYLLLSNKMSWSAPNTGIIGDDIKPDITELFDTQFISTQSPLRGVGEIENVFPLGYNYDNETGLSRTLTEAVGVAYELDTANEEIGIVGSELRSWGRIDLKDPNFWPMLDFVTYFDPAADNIIDNDGNPYTSGNPFMDGIDNNLDGFFIDDPIADPLEGLPYFYEQAVPGRININTAPWLVIRQLPWMTDELAHAIVAFRDKTNLGLKIPGAPNYSDPNPLLRIGRTLATHNPLATAPDPNIYSEFRGFRHIGELTQIRVPNPTTVNGQFDIRQYMLDGVNNGNPIVPPDFSGDLITDDFEERDLIFQRISNLVTVRSDVFTAYILVRIGRTGPQKRMIAIFDRSNCFLPTDTPKLVALHPVPDPR
ncbi:hypothetical protein ACFL02_01515 [Planctomycetota bacterium]